MDSLQWDTSVRRKPVPRADILNAPQPTQPDGGHRSPDFARDEAEPTDPEATNAAEEDSLVSPATSLRDNEEIDHDFAVDDHRRISSQHSATNIQTTKGLKEYAMELPKQHSNVLRRVGRYSIFLAALSLVFIITAMGFLAWMWLGDRSCKNWRRIMLHNWSKQAVTLAALFLRTAILTLAGTATAMIASIALENRGVPLEDAARVSIARFSSSGPEVFWLSMFWRRSFIAARLRILLILLLATSIASQFSSTILLTDLGQGNVLDYPVTTRQNFSGFSWTRANYTYGVFQSPNSPFWSVRDYWANQPSAFQSFAEYSEPAKLLGNVDDTGLTLRSFLPIPDQAVRKNVLSFSGFVPVFDARIVCVQPSILSYDTHRPYFNMTVDLPSAASVPGLVPASGPIQISCPGTVRGWTLCPLNISAGGLLPFLDPVSREDYTLKYDQFPLTDNAPPEHPDWNGEQIYNTRFQGKLLQSGRWRASKGSASCGVDFGNAWAIVNFTTWRDTENQALGGGGWYNWTVEKDSGPWMKVNDVNSTLKQTKPVGWVSVCFDSLPLNSNYYQVQEFNITAQGKEDRIEPTFGFNLQKNAFDTLGVRRQLGALGASKDNYSRGILDLASVPDLRQQVESLKRLWSNYCTTAPTYDNFTSVINDIGVLEGVDQDPNVYNRSTYPWMNVMGISGILNLEMCTGDCSLPGNVDVSGYLKQKPSTGMATLFNDVLQDTNSPALALQAMLTQVLREVYYDWLPTFDSTSDVTTTSVVSVLIPLRYRGFWAVFAITCAHLVLRAIAGIGFAFYTRTSHLQNAWQAVSDVADNKDGAEVLGNVGHLRDRAVSQWIEQNAELKDRRFRLPLE